jgi:hypothetical protein
VSVATAISLVIGAWGAVIATVLAVREIKHSRRSLKIICTLGTARHDDGTLQKVLLVRAINEGSRPVELHGVTFRMENGKELWATPVAGRNDLKKLLGDGQSASFHYDTVGLEEAERAAQVPIAFAVVADASANEYLKPYPRS